MRIAAAAAGSRSVLRTGPPRARASGTRRHGVRPVVRVSRTLTAAIALRHRPSPLRRPTSRLRDRRRADTRRRARRRCVPARATAAGLEPISRPSRTRRRLAVQASRSAPLHPNQECSAAFVSVGVLRSTACLDRAPGNRVGPAAVRSGDRPRGPYSHWPTAVVRGTCAARRRWRPRCPRRGSRHPAPAVSATAVRRDAAAFVCRREWRPFGAAGDVCREQHDGGQAKSSTRRPAHAASRRPPRANKGCGARPDSGQAAVR